MNPRLAVWAALGAMLAVAGCAHNKSYDQPPGRLVGAMAIDSANHRAILFGGIAANTAYCNDVWALSLDDYRWQLLSVTGTAPGRRARHTMVYDAPNHRMLVFGGNDMDGNLYNDLWALYLTPHQEGWEKLAPAGPLPVPRTLPTAVYCPTRHSMLVYGGATADTGTGDVFELDIDSLKWHELALTGAMPHARCSAGGFYDAATNSMVIFGGVFNDFYNDAWSLDLTPGSEHWDSLAVSGTAPDARAGFASGYVPDARKFYVTAGWGGYTNAQDVYILDMATMTWSMLTPPGPAPAWRRNPASALDPFNGNLLVFSGDGSGAWTPVEDSTPYLQVVGGVQWHKGPGRE